MTFAELLELLDLCGLRVQTSLAGEPSLTPTLPGHEEYLPRLMPFVRQYRRELIEQSPFRCGQCAKAVCAPIQTPEDASGVYEFCRLFVCPFRPE